MQHVSALMDHIGVTGLVLALAVIFAGSMVQASIGIGLNLFSVGLLAMIDPVFAPGPVLVHSFLLSVIASVSLRRDIEVRALALSIGGVALGTAFAAVLLAWLPREGMPQILGGLIVLAVLMTAAGLRIVVTPASIVAATAAAGVMGTIAGAHGAPVALLYQRETPQRVRAALLPFFTIANPLAIAALAWAGMFGWREFWASLLLVPALVAGFLAAPLLARTLPPAMIRASLLAISGASGLALLFKT